MQATRIRPSRDQRLEVDGVLYRLRVFDEARVVVATGPQDWPRHLVSVLAEGVECAFDVRLFGTSWRLVAGDDQALRLVTFTGFDSSGLLGAAWYEVPPVLAEWLLPACA